MKSKKKHTSQDLEIVDGIGKYMDDDIQRIIEGKQLELGDRELPPFDEYRIYKNIQEAVMREEKRKNRRIRMPLFFKWTVACAIVLLVIGVGYNFYQSHSEANKILFFPVSFMYSYYICDTKILAVSTGSGNSSN